MKALSRRYVAFMVLTIADLATLPRCKQLLDCGIWRPASRLFITASRKQTLNPMRANSCETEP